MLTYFPTPFPDELLYSVIARYHVWTRRSSYERTMEDFFGTKRACAIVDFPKRLEVIFQQLSRKTKNCPNTLIQQNTMFPLFQPFLSKEQSFRAIYSMISKNSRESPQQIFGLLSGDIKSISKLRYCPTCAKVDKEIYGESYWHRSHQVFGVNVCSLHGDALYECEKLIAKHMFIDLFEALKMNNLPIVIRTQEHFKIYKEIADSVYWLLNNQLQVIDYSFIQSNITSLLQRRGFLTLGNRIRVKRLLKSFTQYYGNDLLSELKINTYEDKDYGIFNFLRNLNRKSVMHPLKYILILHFLGVKPGQFFSEKRSVKTVFGEGPWPCLNRAASHYMQEVITDYKIIASSSKPVAVFTCECGFSYSRMGTEEAGTDRTTVRSIITYGHIWESELISLANQGYTIKEIAEKLNVCSSNVDKQLRRLKGEGSSTESHERPIDAKKDATRQKYRMEWKKILRENPEKTISQLSKIRPGVKSWLYIYDRDWLHLNRPSITSKTLSKGGTRSFNWEMRDKELVKQVESAAKIIEAMDSHPIRITPTEIFRHLGVKFIDRGRLSKMPLTQEVLTRLTETVEDFRIRRRNIG